MNGVKSGAPFGKVVKPTIKGLIPQMIQDWPVCLFCHPPRPAKGRAARFSAFFGRVQAAVGAVLCPAPSAAYAERKCLWVSFCAPFLCFVKSADQGSLCAVCCHWEPSLSAMIFFDHLTHSTYLSYQTVSLRSSVGRVYTVRVRLSSLNMSQP